MILFASQFGTLESTAFDGSGPDVVWGLDCPELVGKSQRDNTVDQQTVLHKQMSTA